MKLIQLSFFIVISFCLSSELLAQSRIGFERTVHNLGTIKEENGKTTADFTFKNIGTSPLMLTGVRTSCGCAIPSWTRNPVDPGRSGSIRVTFDPKNRPGKFSKTIRVTSNASNAMVMLKIEGEVIGREKTIAELYPKRVGSINMRTNHVPFSRVNKTELRTKEVEFINLTNAPVTVGTRNLPSHISVSVEPSMVKPQQKGKFVIKYDASKHNAYGYTNTRVYLTMNGKADHRNSFAISATLQEDFGALTEEQKKNAPVASFDDREFNFKTIKQGDVVEHTFVLKNTGKSDLLIRRVRVTCGCTAVNPNKKSIKPGESTELKVAFNSKGKRGRQNRSITVITNDPVRSTSVLRLIGTVEVPSVNP